MDGVLTDDELQALNAIQLQQEARSRGLGILPGNRDQKLAALLADNAAQPEGS